MIRPGGIQRDEDDMCRGPLSQVAGEATEAAQTHDTGNDRNGVGTDPPETTEAVSPAEWVAFPYVHQVSKTPAASRL